MQRVVQGTRKNLLARKRNIFSGHGKKFSNKGIDKPNFTKKNSPRK